MSTEERLARLEDAQAASAVCEAMAAKRELGILLDADERAQLVTAREDLAGFAAAIAAERT